MILLRLLGIGAVYGLAFAIVKSLFPSPLILLTLDGGDRTVLALFYMGAGLVAGLISGPIFGGILLSRRRSGDGETSGGTRLVLSLGLALLMGAVSGVLTLAAYSAGLVPQEQTLDPLALIRASNFPTGTPLLIAWTIARDLLPAGLTGLFLSPVGGGPLLRLYEAGRPLTQKTYDEDF